MANQVEELLREYTAKLHAMIRGQLERDVTAAVHQAFTGAVSTGQTRRAGRGTGDSGVRRAGKTHGGASSARSRRGRGGKRSPEKIAKLADKLLTHIAANSGQRAEQISEAMKISTGDLSLPLKKLVADKKVKTSGVARGTTYAVAK